MDPSLRPSTSLAASLELATSRSLAPPPTGPLSLGGLPSRGSTSTTDIDEYNDDDPFSDDEGRRGLAKWDLHEDEVLKLLVTQHGTKHWNLVAQHLPGRTGKQCRYGPHPSQ